MDGLLFSCLLLFWEDCKDCWEVCEFVELFFWSWMWGIGVVVCGWVCWFIFLMLFLFLLIFIFLCFIVFLCWSCCILFLNFIVFFGLICIINGFLLFKGIFGFDKFNCFVGFVSIFGCFEYWGGGDFCFLWELFMIVLVFSILFCVED